MPLREFVYVDDVSVYSLLASLKGPVVTELTETQARALRDDMRIGGGIGAGFAKLEGAATTSHENTESTQVLRKATIQTSFAELLRAVREDLVLEGSSDGGTSEGHNEELGALAQDRRDRRAIPETELVRGRLVEIDIELSTEPVYEAARVIRYFSEMIGRDGHYYGISPSEELAEARVVERMVERLSAGLVPLRGVAKDHQVVTQDGGDVIVQNDLLDRLEVPEDRIRPLYVVGVVDESRFWKDARRLLFSENTYRGLVRISRDGIHDAWTPLKLADVFSKVAPDLGREVSRINEIVLPAMSAGFGQSAGTPRLHLREAIRSYGRHLAAASGVEVPEIDVAHAAELCELPTTGDLTVEAWRDLTNPVTQLIRDRAGEGLDRLTLTEVRLASLLAFQEVRKQRPLEPQEGEEFIESLPRPGYLEAEFIALYW